MLKQNWLLQLFHSSIKLYWKSTKMVNFRDRHMPTKQTKHCKTKNSQAALQLTRPHWLKNKTKQKSKNSEMA